MDSFQKGPVFLKQEEPLEPILPFLPWVPGQFREWLHQGERTSSDYPCGASDPSGEGCVPPPGCGNHRFGRGWVILPLAGLMKEFQPFHANMVNFLAGLL